ncbi:MAG: peptidase S24 [Chlamydiae bacterium CG10_big_fil_rev_8_21_14_0_10_35_9]|nr:MAG: peptidase S24 [Chlamydiae bacterium CG10_big_fil_rev_8_21_14_0_10_35_9]
MKLTFLKPDLQTPCDLPLFMSPVRAGFPSPAEDYLEQSLDLNKHLIKHPAATFFVRVDGDSMKDASIHKGDILIVDRAIPPSNGKIVIAALQGEFTVKRIQIKDGEIFLCPENPSFKPIKIEADSDFHVWGVVTYVIHKL